MEQICENPYLQYFLGFKELCEKAPFNASMMVHFRSRFTAEHHALINSKLIAQATGTAERADQRDGDVGSNPSQNAGKLLVDATCTPADIRYPSDLSLLNEAREKTEAMIYQFHRHIVDSVKKPRTYRQNARKQYLALPSQQRCEDRKEAVSRTRMNIVFSSST